jgi:hypothetical protein
MFDPWKIEQPVKHAKLFIEDALKEAKDLKGKWSMTYEFCVKMEAIEKMIEKIKETADNNE